MKKKISVPKNRSSVFCMVFLILFAFCLIASLVMAILSRGGSFYNTLFYAETVTTNRDFFMDFYNSIRDASSMSVYDRGVIYPPLANLLFWLFSKLISRPLANSSFDLRYSLQINQNAIIIYLVFSLICIIFFSLMIKNYLKHKNSVAAAEIFSFIFIFFYPFYYCLERGNIILLAMILSAFFVFFHDSPSKKVRETSYILLAIAAGLKIYPAVFGLILLSEKRYKAAMRTALYGLLFFFVPFLFYDHGASLFTFIENIINFSSQNKAHFSYDSVSIINLFYYLGDQYVSLGKIVFVITELAAIVLIFIAPKKWQKYMLMSYAILNIHSVSSAYCMVFMIIPFICFISAENKKHLSDWIYLFLFAVMLLPLPCFYYNDPSSAQWFFDIIHITPNAMMNKLFGWASVQFIYFLVCVESVSYLIDARKSGKKIREFFYKKPERIAKNAAGSAGVPVS